ncbi:MAG: glutathione S-transferase N-terminal domain-containing protein [Rhodospirillaceae bacterium]|nr:glutathione S-transferase N-terminal domain-containing protein [Rhodospirillaceae bacterium]
MFRLRSSTTSPFVRKVIVTAIETGQEGEIELVPTSTVDPASGLSADNPLGKVPALVMADGSTLYDSRVICEFLDSRHQGARLFPAEGPARWTALRRQALADGMLDAAVLRVMEGRRADPTQRSPEWVAKQKLKVEQGLDQLEREAGGFGTGFDIGLLTIAVTLDYFDFRFKDDAWRKGRSNLAEWHEAVSARPSLGKTLPHD